MKINKYKQLGSGWHNQSQRHSNAVKYGFAGGLYAEGIPLSIKMSAPTFEDFKRDGYRGLEWHKKEKCFQLKEKYKHTNQI